MAVTTEPDQTVGFDPLRSRTATRRRRRWRRGIGSLLVAGGVLLVGYVAYQYWGTNWIASRSQNRLRSEIAQKGFQDYQVGAPQTGTESLRPVPRGALGFIKIPRLNLDMVFIEGVSPSDLKLGPGHYPTTPLPGQRGNVGIAGHRTTYLHPFWALNDLKPGDRIILETKKGVFTYKVRWLKVIVPTDGSVLAPTQVSSLTLTTCHPRFSASHRLVVRAVLVSGPGTREGGTPEGGTPSTLPGE
jgi:sortase A